jgi:hypothetical protein
VQFAESYNNCPNCQKNGIITLALNDEECDQLTSEYENADCVHELGKKRFVLCDDERMVFFFSSRQAAIDFSRGYAPQKQTQMMINLVDIEEIGYPRIAYAKNQGRVYSFNINTTHQKNIRFHCSTQKNNKQFDENFYNFFSILLIRSRLYYRRIGISMLAIPNKWMYASMLALSGFGIGKAIMAGEDSIWHFSFLFLLFPFIYYTFTHGKECKLFFIKDEAKAVSDTEIIEYEASRKKDKKQFCVILVVVFVLFFGLGLLLL